MSVLLHHGVSTHGFSIRIDLDVDVGVKIRISRPCRKVNPYTGIFATGESSAAIQCHAAALFSLVIPNIESIDLDGPPCAAIRNFLCVCRVIDISRGPRLYVSMYKRTQIG